MIITEVYQPFIVWDFWHSLNRASSSNRACNPLLPLEAILSLGCFDFTCFRVENTDSQTYVDPNIDSILSAARLTLGIFPLAHFSITQ